MHPRKKAKTKEITKTILDLVANGLMTWAILGSPRTFGKTNIVLEASINYSYSRIKRTMQRLRAQDMIKYDERDLKSPIILTEKGMRRLSSYRLRDIFKKKRRWDHFWRLLLFDISEKKRQIRKALRRALIEAGFYPLQKSVLVCPFDCEEKIMEICRLYKVSDNVMFCLTASLGDRDDEVREFFFAQGKHE